MSDDSDDGDDDDDGTDGESVVEEPQPLQPFVVPRYLRIGYPGSQWTRDTLFNGERGEIGLAWSTFKILGTPNATTWPVRVLFTFCFSFNDLPQEFAEFPGAKSVVFNDVPAAPMEPMLPNLPPSLRHATSSSSALLTEAERPLTSVADPSHTPAPRSTPFDLLSRFLVYPSASRQTAEDALHNPWLAADNFILMPRFWEADETTPSVANPSYPAHLQEMMRTEWEGKTLGELLTEVLATAPRGSPGGGYSGTGGSLGRPW